MVVRSAGSGACGVGGREKRGGSRILEESARYGEVVALIVAGAGIALVVYAVFLRKSIFIMAAGALVAAAAFVAPMLLRVPPVSVVVVRSQNADVAVERRDVFYGGTYHGRDGARLAVPTDRRFGRTATILINDSDRLVTVTGYSYSAVPNAAGSADLLAYLLPGEAQVFPRRINTFGSDADGPPKEIVSESAVGFLSYLAYGAKPYKDAGSPTAEELDAALTMPPGRALKGLSPVAD